MRRIGAAGFGEMVADPDRVEHPLRRGGQRGGAPVIARAGARIGVGGVDDRAAQPARIERRGQRQPDQPAAKDDHVASFHAARCRRSGAPRRASSRLTRESGARHCGVSHFTGGNYGERRPASTKTRARAALARQIGRIRCAASRAAARARSSSRSGVGLALALITYSSVDPSLTTAAGGPPTNWLGAAGAYSSDLLLLLFGPAAALFLPLLILTGVRLLREVDGGRARPRGARRAGRGGPARACRGAVRRHRGQRAARRLGRRARARRRQWRRCA